MLDNQKKQDNRRQSPIKREDISRKLYKKPHLEKLGDLRTLTLGSSGPTVESGGGWMP